MIDTEQIDAIIVTASWKSIDEIILPILKYNIPCMIEKPIALTSNKIHKIIDLIKLQDTHIQIGYNRRFYHYTKDIINYINDNPIRSVIAEIPESINLTDIELGQNLWIQNSTHVLDMMKLFFGKYYIINKSLKKFLNNEYYDTFSLLLSTENGFPINIISNWNAPSNFSLSIFFNDTVIKISPLEYACLYKGFDIIEPTVNSPVRKFNPIIEKEFYCSKEFDIFKPGFLNQHRYFFDLMGDKEKADYNPTTLNDILFYSHFIESLYE
tara:strand:+ start:14370 stop:15173 length:804 start_codon:yes stop_codon:yes gene_type:complete